MSRFSDWRHERAIAKQAKAFSAAQGGDSRREWAKLEKLILARSPEQIARMERAEFNAMDPHAQRTFLDSKGGGAE